MPDSFAELLAAELGGAFAVVAPQVAALRLVAAMLLGAAVGWERERHAKPAGLRTHILIALASCLFTLIAFELMGMPIAGEERLRIDPIRLIEAVTAGVTFLAAGTIITGGGRVQGLTTGAGMWLAGAIGLACGSGEIPLAAMVAVLAVIVLWLVRRLFESHGPDDRLD